MEENARDKVTGYGLRDMGYGGNALARIFFDFPRWRGGAEAQRDSYVYSLLLISKFFKEFYFFKPLTASLLHCDTAGNHPRSGLMRSLGI